MQDSVSTIDDYTVDNPCGPSKFHRKFQRVVFRNLGKRNLSISHWVLSLVVNRLKTS